MGIASELRAFELGRLIRRQLCRGDSGSCRYGADSAKLRWRCSEKPLQVMQEYGISHRGVREDDTLFCKDTNEAMMMDFEWSEILEALRTTFVRIDYGIRAETP